MSEGQTWPWQWWCLGRRAEEHFAWGSISSSCSKCIPQQGGLCLPALVSETSKCRFGAELPWNDPCLSKAGFAPQKSIKVACACDKLELLQHVPCWHPATVAVGFTPVQLPGARSIPSVVVSGLTEDNRTWLPCIKEGV